MSNAAVRFVQTLSRTPAIGARAFTVGTAAYSRDNKASKRAPVLQMYEKLNLSKLDPIYDDVDENSSVINLWKRQKAAEIGVDASGMDSVDAIVRQEHNIEDLPEDMLRPFPKQPPPPELLAEKEDPEMFWSTDLNIPYEEFRALAKKTLVVKRTVQMTRKGKIPSMYALVVVGNGRGSAGYGEGKGNESAKAVLFATREAIKNMNYFPRYDDRTIFHDIDHKFKATKVVLWARRPGFGCRVSPIIHEICECIGIQDLAGKIHGSRNPMNVIKATFEALTTQRVPSDLAKARGMRLIDVNHTYYQGITPVNARRSRF